MRSSTSTRPRSSVLTPALSRPRSSTSGAAAGGDAQVVELVRVAAEGHLHRRLPGLGALDVRVRDDLDVLLLDLARGVACDLLVLERQDLRQRLEQHDLGAHPPERAGDLGARRACADHRQPLRLLGEMPARGRVEDAVAELEPEQRLRDGARGEHDLAGLDLVAVEAPADHDVAVVGQRAVTLDQRRSCSS